MRQDLKGKVSGWISQFRSQQAGEASARGGGGRGGEGGRGDQGEVGAKGRGTPAKDPYNITAKEPCSSAKEPYSSAKEPSISGSSDEMLAHLCSASALLSSAQFRAEAVERGEATEDRDGARDKRREAREEKVGAEKSLSFASSPTHSPSLTRTHTLPDSPTQTHLAYPAHSPVLAGNARHAENTVTVGMSSSSHCHRDTLADNDSPCHRDALVENESSCHRDALAGNDLPTHRLISRYCSQLKERGQGAGGKSREGEGGVGGWQVEGDRYFPG